MAKSKRMKVDDIIVYERHRKDLGDIPELAADIEANGLINPITINSDNELLAGERRLAAVVEIGWSDIDCTILSADNEIDIEWSENEMRKNFTVSERTAINKARREKLEVEAEARMMAGVKVEGDDPAGTCREGSRSSTESAEASAKMSGLGSARTATKAENVVEKGSVAVIKAMDDEDLSINLASQLVKAVPSKADQAKVLSEGKAAVRAAIANSESGKKHDAPPPREYAYSSMVENLLDRIGGQMQCFREECGGLTEMMKSKKWDNKRTKYLEQATDGAARQLSDLHKEIKRHARNS